MPDHINPDKIPYVTEYDGLGYQWPAACDATAVRAGAKTLWDLADKIAQGGTDTANAWAKIDTCYSGPDDQIVWTAMSTLPAKTDAVQSDLQTVSSALTQFANAIDPILQTLASLQQQARDLVTDIQNFKPYRTHNVVTPQQEAYSLPGIGTIWDGLSDAIGHMINNWYEDPDLLARNTDLEEKVSVQAADFEQAERDCANKIDKLFGGIQYVPYEFGVATVNLPGSVYGYDPANPPTAGLPWGSPVERQYSAAWQLTNFVTDMFGGIFYGVVVMVDGVAMTVGALTGLEGKDAFKQSWTGLKNLAVSIATAGQAKITVTDPATGQTTTEKSYHYLMGAVTAIATQLFAVPDWGNRPAGFVTGELMFNFASIIFPFMDLGKGATIADAAAMIEDPARAADVAAAVERAAEAGYAGDIDAALRSLQASLDEAAESARAAATTLDPAMLAADTGRAAGYADDIINATKTFDDAAAGAKTATALDPGAAVAADTARAGESITDVADTAGPGRVVPEEYTPPQVSHDVVWDQHVGLRKSFASRTDLAPNTHYEVPGRGDFYTDDTGKVTYVDTHWGPTGARNPDLIHPAPDATYVVHQGDVATYVYKTDSLSRTIHAETDDYKPVEGADRSDSIQQRIGHLGGGDYDGGHLISNQAGAGGEDIGTVPMLRSLNQNGGYYQLEQKLQTTWKDLQVTDPGAKIKFQVDVHYPGTSEVPDSFRVGYSVDGGPWVWKDLPNVK
ncbi:MAG: DNA/RNA non-specific endonuclease [Propionibacteriaceae bacterium]|nr:DNA/RNA non-specific endonuclease [Propionibacteriaceae bacterium]